MTCILDREQDLQFFTHKIIARKRDEEVPNFVKYIKTTAIIRTFDKDKSVFADWRLDNEWTGPNCMEHDLKIWAGKNFIKSEEDLFETENVLRKYAKEIKNIYI